MRASLQDMLGYSSHEIVVDLFAGGGGASLGIEMCGYRVDAAVNHNPLAVAIHRANHPHTEHYTQDVFSVSPRWITRGRRVGLLWASPDCTDHSKAKGGVPIRNAKRRELARVITDKWIPDLKPSGCHPRVIWMENVEEFQDWGPLDSKGCIISTMRGASFKKFCRDLRRHGYRVEYRELRASHYGVPTIRKRLYLCARRDGMPIVWPEPTHGAPTSSDVKSGRLKPWRTTAEIIDWSLPCPSIFETSKEIKAKHGIRARRPLKESTLRRVAKGIQRYVIDAAEPFIVTCNHSGEGFRGHGIHEPMKTITAARDAHGLVMPFIQHVQHGSAPGGVMPADEPMRTVTEHPKGGGMALVAAHLQRQFGNSVVTACIVGAGGPEYGGKPTPVDVPMGSILTENHKALASCVLAYYGTDQDPRIDDPLHTVTTVDRFALVTGHIASFYGHDGAGQSPADPLRTITSVERFALVQAFLAEYTSGDVQPLVRIDGELYVITDIGLRMLTPRELARAQGFPDTYIIEFVDGKCVKKEDQVAMIGNSVCPGMAAALVAANYVPQRVAAPDVYMPLLEAMA